MELSSILVELAWNDPKAKLWNIILASWLITKMRDRHGYGARTQILGCGFRHLKFLAPAPDQFGPLKTKKHCYLYSRFAPQNMSVERELKFQLQLHHSKYFSSSHPKLLGL